MMDEPGVNDAAFGVIPHTCRTLYVPFTAEIVTAADRVAFNWKPGKQFRDDTVRTADAAFGVVRMIHIVDIRLVRIGSSKRNAIPCLRHFLEDESQEAPLAPPAMLCPQPGKIPILEQEAR